MIEVLRKVIKRLHYPIEVMLVCVRWYSAHPLSLRHIEEMMVERGVFVDHATVHRWSIKILPVLAAVFRRRKRPVGISWQWAIHLTGARRMLSRWSVRAQAFTTPVLWVSFRRGSSPTWTAWTTSSGCDGPPGSSARNAATLVDGGWETGGSCARTVAAARP